MIQGHRCLYPAATLMEMSGQREFMRRKRGGPQSVLIEGIQVIIRDQEPLYSGNMCLPAAYAFDAFIECLNRKVFFWPGSADGPIDYGVRHFNRYKSERPVILKVRTAELLAANPHAVALYCAYNSGSPRCSNGKKSPRGFDTFAKVDEFARTPGRVVEVTFETSVALPVDTRHGRTPQGPWRSMEWT